ncbi:MAG: MBL fold metallo-hydrolase [Polyangiaceae bacterium]|nr:MBL fold metallo-hydrolase [Polyangiaceae bacterium]
MNIDFLGHAMLLIRGAEGTILFDPLFFGAHHEGLYEVYPRRELDIEQLPPLDAVFLSQARLDHFDLHSMALMPRELPIYCAADSLLLACLDGLGFLRIRPLRNLEPVTIGSLEIIPTPGAADTIQHGFIVRDGNIVLWNLVDTNPPLSVIAEIRLRFPEIHLAIVPWQPLQDQLVAIGGARQFPYEMYGTIISTALQIGARSLVPGSCGFRATGHHAWLNHVLFPITRTRFVEDVVRANPAWDSQIFEMDSGDRIVLTQDVVGVQKNQVEYCKSGPYRWEELAYRPDDAGCQVNEHRGELFSIASSLPFVSAFFEDHMLRIVNQERTLFEGHRRLHVRQQFDIVFADGRRSWTWAFSGEHCVCTPGQCALADVSSILTASLLTGLVAGTVSWDFASASGDYRHYSGIHAVSACGVYAPLGARLEDPLSVVFGARSTREKWFAEQIERLLTAGT